MIIKTNDTGLRVELHGREQLLSLRAKIDVPLDTIKSISFEPTFQDWRKWEVRMPGTHAPKLLLAGSYWTEEGWDFLYVKKPRGILSPMVENVLVIETDQNRYCRVILSIEPEEAGRIVKWWQKTSKNLPKKKQSEPSAVKKVTFRSKLRPKKLSR